MARLKEASVREVLSQVGPVLRALVAENVKLASALAENERREEAENIVSSMEQRGLSDTAVPYKQKVAQLLSSKKDLAVVKEALALVTPDMSFASLSDGPSGDATDTLEGYLLSGQ
jgi:hypothetical protein